MTEEREATRAWLQLLSASNAIKKSVDTAFRAQFGVSISRFDVMSALARSGREGLRAGELSQLLMVTEGNTTQVTAPLVRDGYLQRQASPDDARVAIFTLTERGESLFARMARAHHAWISNTFADFSDSDVAKLRELLARLPAPTASSPNRRGANKQSPNERAPAILADSRRRRQRRRAISSRPLL